MSAFETIVLERSALGVVRITLNRPERLNAINDAMWSELGAVFKALRFDSQARVVILTGAGDGFCSGADISPRGPEERPHQLMKMRLVEDVAMTLQGLPQPTIAQVNGVAAGAGCSLAFGCDMIVASDQARFSEIFARRGISLDFGGSWLLPRLIGLHKAKQLAFFADVIDAAEAERFGIVNEVVPASDLAAFVDNWANRLCGIAPIPLAQTKALLNRSVGPSMYDALQAEGAAQVVNNATQDTQEAMTAYREKREPVFRGR